MIQDEYARMFWQDYTADTMGTLLHALGSIGKKGHIEKPILYSEIAHEHRRKDPTDGMTAKEIIAHIASKL